MNGILTIYTLLISLTILITVIFYSNTSSATSNFESTNMNLPITSSSGTQDLELNVKDIVVNKPSQNTTDIKIIFAVHNPQPSTVLLDGIHYNIFVNNLTLSSGDIGSEALIDVMRSEPEFPIIGNDTIVIKDALTLQKSQVKNDVWNIVNDGTECFAVNGTFFYRQAAGLSAPGGANDFHTTFPNNCK